MKIRKGFVSNSSSSSFILTFCGDSEEDCFKVMRKHDSLFNHEHLYSEYFPKINVNDVIKMIEEVIVVPDIDKIKENTYNWDNGDCYIFDLSFVISMLKDRISRQKKQLEKAQGVKDKTINEEYIVESYPDVISEEEEKLSTLEKAYNYGHNKLIRFECGDNDGHYVGGTGGTMDSCMNNISFLSDDFGIFGECRH